MISLNRFRVHQHINIPSVVHENSFASIISTILLYCVNFVRVKLHTFRGNDAEANKTFAFQKQQEWRSEYNLEWTLYLFIQCSCNFTVLRYISIAIAIYYKTVFPLLVIVSFTRKRAHAESHLSAWWSVARITGPQIVVFIICSFLLWFIGVTLF